MSDDDKGKTEQSPALRRALKSAEAGMNAERPEAAVAALELCRALMFSHDPEEVGVAIAVEKLGWERAGDMEDALQQTIHDLWEDLETVTIAVMEVTHAIVDRATFATATPAEREERFWFSQQLRYAAERLDRGDSLDAFAAGLIKDIEDTFSAPGTPVPPQFAAYLHAIANAISGDQP